MTDARTCASSWWMGEAPSQRLFRREVFEQRAERLHGDVQIAVPLSWQVIGFGMLATLIAVVTFLMLASYSRVVTVSGSIIVEQGVATVLPTRLGTVVVLPVRDGQKVRAGAPLAIIRAEEDLTAGGTAAERIKLAVSEQDRHLESQRRLVLDAASAEQARLAAQQQGLRREIAEIDSQLRDQTRLVEVAAAELDQVSNVADRGFISRRDLEAREGTLLARRQQLAQLQQQRASRMASLAEADRAMAQSAAAAQAQAASVQSDRAALANQIAQAESAQGYVLRSPIGGQVTAVTARRGQVVGPTQSLMAIVPEGATIMAELHVPTAAAGFIAPGQSVRLAIDAFPYQQFGSVKGRIVEVSSVAIPRTVENGATLPVYLVRVRLDRPIIRAFGKDQALVPGMTLTARITTQRRSLLEWLFEPVFAVRNR